MPLCDLCGKETQLARAKIERAILSVCPVCAKYGDILEEKKAETPRFKRADQPARAEHFSFQKTEIPENSIEDNYALIIKTAREKAGLTQEQLAKAIAEKENIIHRMETRQQEPPLKTAKKLEQFLHIKLITKEKKEETSSLDIDFSETEMTIGDLLKLSKDIKDSEE